MKRFLWALAVIAIFELAIFGAGWKYCGDAGWGVAFMFAGPLLMWPWMIVAAAAAFFVRGVDVVDRFLARPRAAAVTFFAGCLLAPAIAYAATHPSSSGCLISW